MSKRGKNTLLAKAKQAANEAKKLAKYEQKQTQKIAKEQIKEMRPYLKKLRQIDLRKKVSPQKRSAISKAWQEYQELTTRPFKIYRTKNKKKLNIAQTYSRHEKGKTKFDVAFVPTADPKAKLNFKDDRVIVKSKYVTETVLFFDVRNLAVDPLGEIQNALAKNPNAKQFIIMAGKYLYNGGLARSLVENKILNLMAHYSPGGKIYEKRGPNSHFENWLFGLVAFEAHNQGSINDYRREYGNALAGIKDKKRKQRRRNANRYGKKF